jgi:hypothetical protein
MANMVFYNCTDKMAKWSGSGGQTITVQVSDGLLPTSHDVRAGDHWTYNAKSSKVKVKFKSKTYTRGFESYTTTQQSCNDMSRELYIVESNHKMTFNFAIEWPPRFPDKL